MKAFYSSTTVVYKLKSRLTRYLRVNVWAFMNPQLIRYMKALMTKCIAHKFCKN